MDLAILDFDYADGSFLKPFQISDPYIFNLRVRNQEIIDILTGFFLIQNADLNINYINNVERGMTYLVPVGAVRTILRDEEWKEVNKAVAIEILKRSVQAKYWE